MKRLARTRHLRAFLVLSLLFCWLGCAEEEETAPGIQPVPPSLLGTGDADQGADLFLNCTSSACHGLDGMSGLAPTLGETVPSLTDEQLAYVLRFGFGDMPGTGMSDKQILDVIAHLRERFPTMP